MTVGRRKNVLFLLLDAFRHDLFTDREDLKILAPNLAALVEQGFERRIVSNGMITKVAMPALLTQTYPLDHGGYNDVIGGRPASFVELLREAGYSTYMLVSHCITGPTGNVERGADRVDSVWDHHMLLDMYIRHVLLHELDLWADGARSDEEIAARIRTEMGDLLAYIEQSADRSEDSFLPSRLRKLSGAEARRYASERALIEQDPLCVALKVRNIPPKMYRCYLGRERAGASLKVLVSLERLRAFANRVVQFITRQPLQLFPGYVAPVASEVRRIGLRFICEAEGPWFAFLHLMDAHDYKRMNRPLNFLNKMRFLPRLLRIKRAGKTARDPLYDLSVAYLDSQIGKLLAELTRQGKRDDLIIVGVGDHGFGWDRDRETSLMTELGFRTHYEHIEVPFLMAPASRQPLDRGLADSMSVSATLLDELGIEPHPSFRGRSIFQEGRQASIVETVGRGNTDLKRRDIYFTITSETHKLMTVLRGPQLIPQRLYDLRRDPRELVNLNNDAAQIPNVECLIDLLWSERHDLLERRGVGRTRSSGTASEQSQSMLEAS